MQDDSFNPMTAVAVMGRRRDRRCGHSAPLSSSR